jgi:hypothetical protein
MKRTLLSVLLTAACSAAALAQTTSGEFAIVKITPDLVTTPEYNVNFGPKNKRITKNKDFLEVEVTFDWQPKDRDAKFLDEITINYFILLNNESRENKGGTLLTGSVTHVAIPNAKALNSVMYVSPRTLERFFDGKVPTSASSAIKDIGVTITKQGQLVAEGSWKGRGQWWSSLQQVTGYVLNKNETPFAPLVWDYYEAIKTRPAGM